MGMSFGSACLPVSMAVSTNTRLPQTIGVAEPRPGMGVFQATFVLSSQRSGGLALGASPVVVFGWIILPLILPGVISGALFAFVTSFDEVVVALFVTGPAERTLPRQMFNGIRENISPVITAAATFVILVSVLLLTVLELLRRRNERLREIRP